MRLLITVFICLSSFFSLSYAQVPGTMQRTCSNNQIEIPCPQQGEPFYGQDAQFPGPVSYQHLPDNLVYDNTTQLTWTQAYPNISWEEAKSLAKTLTLGDHTDWRLPTIKELYTLMRFSGVMGTNATTSIPYIDTDFFTFSYPEPAKNEAEKRQPGHRFIDVQFWSSNEYVGRTMHNDRTIFGVNFADGRIKGYPLFMPRSQEQRPYRMFARFVRGPVHYGEGKLTDNQDGTVSDAGTQLMWQAKDDGKTRNWKEALSYCEQLTLGNHQDWRLPNAKALHTIVDYTSSPTTNGRPALRKPLEASNIQSYYWTSTTLIESPPHKQEGKYSQGIYIAFGQAMGWLENPPHSGHRELLDVHGAGAQRSDPKAGNPKQYPQGRGPQGDDIRIYNYVRCVR